MIIRKAEIADYDEIYKLVQAAFETSDVREGDEQDYIVELRAGETFIPELEIIALYKNKIVGHILLLKQTVDLENGVFDCLLLSPLCVAKEYRKLGIGAKLINHSFGIAKKMGYTAVFLSGNPHYYSRFGFKNVAEFGIKNLTAFPGETVQVCPLSENALKGIQGSVYFI